MNTTEFAAALGWTEKAIHARLGALGLLDVCTRCGGSGQYSFCREWGTKCFKCAGTGKQTPKLTAKLSKLAAEKVASGGLVDYLAELSRKQEAKRVLPKLVAECHAVYMVIGAEYSKASREDSAEFVKSRLFSFQCRANRLRYGNTGGCPEERPLFMSVSDVEFSAKRGDLEVTEARRLLEARLSDLNALVFEYRAESA